MLRGPLIKDKIAIRLVLGYLTLVLIILAIQIGLYLFN